MFPRLLPFLCLLSFVQPSIAIAQQSGAASPDKSQESCPVTRADSQSFVPPAPYPATPGEGHFWFGTDRLWTSLPASGSWSGLPHYEPNDPTVRQKLFFWRQGYDPHLEPQPKLTITGKRLDALAPALLWDKSSNGSWRKDQTFIVTGINFPTVGCWEVTGRYENEQLTFVVWVAE